jgi:hypothetical protein
MFKSILQAPGFEVDLKHLKKCYKSLDEDLETLTKALCVWLCVQHKAGQSYDDGYVVMSGYAASGCYLYKVRHMTCRALKGMGNRTGLRVIFAYWPESDTLELIQIYFKADHDLEDQARVRSYLKAIRR